MSLHGVEASSVRPAEGFTLRTRCIVGASSWFQSSTVGPYRIRTGIRVFDGIAGPVTGMTESDEAARARPHRLGSVADCGDCLLVPGGHDEAMTTDRVTLDEVTHLHAYVEFGDAGVGSWPADGEFSLSVGGDESWRGRLSLTALDLAERAWSGRGRAEGLSDEEAKAALRVAVDCDAAFYGLVVAWDKAHVEVEGSVARVAARVWSLPEVLVGLSDRRASVVMELVDAHPTYAVWQIEDAAGTLVTERELALADLDGPTAESRWEHARAAWWASAKSDGCNTAEALGLTLSVSDFESGSCGELRVSAAFN
jgi:hypothetical protein